MQIEELLLNEYWHIYALTGVVCCVLAVVMYILWRRSRGKSRPALPGTGGRFWRKSVYVEILASELTPTGFEHWKTLLHMCMKDAQQAKRLVLLEKRFAPTLQIDDLIDRAVERYRRDIR